ncbi:hypothetical protein B0H14DRAFT_2649996 [Mycena olivaceomarginata]|nr:hypothetical protein B0H14DRAFT_2649996 [Mycena olivaceomarginata]
MLKPAQLVLTCAWSCSNLLNFNFDGMTSVFAVQISLESSEISCARTKLHKSAERRSDYFRKVLYKCNSTSRTRDGLRSGLIPTHFNPIFGAVSPPDRVSTAYFTTSLDQTDVCYCALDLLYRALDLKAVEWTTRLLSLLYPARRCQTPHVLRASRTWISWGASSSPTRFHVAAPEDCDRVRCQDDVLHWLEAAMDMEECCKIVGSMRGRFVEPAEGSSEQAHGVDLSASPMCT